MLTYTKLQTEYQKLTDTSTANVTQGEAWINDSIRTICNLQGGKLRFLEATKDMYTVSGQEGYQIPNSFRKLIDIMVFSEATASSSAVIYSPEMVFDPTKWKRVLQYKFGTQDVPYFTYVENQKYFIQPVPATTGNLIRLRGRKRVAPINIADYTTGTITSIANGGTAVVGSGTTWTADMVGRYIQIPQTTAANGGDGLWYEIGSYTSATSIGLLKPYEGTSISGATASYTIGQVPVVPEAYQEGIVYRAAALYWDDKGEMEKAKRYWLRYDGGNEAGYSQDIGGFMLQMLTNEGETEEGSYIPPFGGDAGGGVPYYFPFQQGSGM